MRYFYILLVLAALLPLRAAQAETITLTSLIEQALQNSPATARILKDVAEAEAKAFEIETLDNPSAQFNITALKSTQEDRVAEIEIEQPLRLSYFGSRGKYAAAIRRTASIEQQAQILELIHSITRGYAAYWALQEQEDILAANVRYTSQKEKLVTQAIDDGLVDVSDGQIFKAETLLMKEQLRELKTKRENAAVNLLRMAGIEQRRFTARRPLSPHIPELSALTQTAGHEGSIYSLLRARNALAERRYAVARQDADFPEFTPRTVLERNFDTDNTTVILGVSIALPIWDRNDAELSRALAEKDLARTQLKALNEHNFANVLATTYRQAVNTQLSASTYRNQIVPAWKEVQSITDTKFENGQASIFDLLQMRERILLVQSEALQSYLNSIEARIELESLIGKSLIQVSE